MNKIHGNILTAEIFEAFGMYLKKHRCGIIHFEVIMKWDV